MESSVNKAGAWDGQGWRITAWGSAALLLLLPLIAMQFTDEVNWDAADFVVFGAMLTAVGCAFELAVRRSGNTRYRVAVAIALVGAFLLLWVNGAVGIIGSENNPANLMFAGVLALGITAALVARFRPQGMARALLATASAQALAGAIALIGAMGEAATVAALSAFFVVLWLFSAWLFRTVTTTQTVS